MFFVTTMLFLASYEASEFSFNRNSISTKLSIQKRRCGERAVVKGINSASTTHAAYGYESFRDIFAVHNKIRKFTFTKLACSASIASHAEAGR